MSSSAVLMMYVSLGCLCINTRSLPVPPDVKQCVMDCGQGFVCRYINTEHGINVQACFPIPESFQHAMTWKQPIQKDTSRLTKHNSRTSWLSARISSALNDIWRGERPLNVRNATFNGPLHGPGRRTIDPIQGPSTVNSRQVTLHTNNGHTTVPTNTSNSGPAETCRHCKLSSDCLDTRHHCYYSPQCAFKICQQV